MKQCRYIGVVTGKQHQDEYNKMALMGLNPVASTIIAIMASDNSETSALFHVWIYFDQPEQKQQQEKKKLVI